MFKPLGDDKRRGAEAPRLPLPRRRSLEVYCGGQEDLPRVTVIGGKNAGLAKRRDRIAGAVEDEIPGNRVLRQEVVAADDVLLVGKVLAVDPQFVPAAPRAPDEVRVPQREAFLVEPGRPQLELLVAAAIRERRAGIEPAAEGGRIVVEGAAQSPF